MFKPYEGIRVLDLSQGIAGPTCAGMLAQGGADVIKVEPPAGDWARLVSEPKDGENALSISANLGKRAICVDASKPAGRALLKRLAMQCDVIVESFRPGVVKRLGLDYETIAKEKPDIIYTSVSGFGPDGPYVERPGTDSVLQALTGMMYMNADGGEPRRVAMYLVDATAAVYAAHATAGALLRQARKGEGHHVNISLMHVAATLQSVPILEYMIRKGGPRLPALVPGGIYPTQDGLLMAASLRDDMFISLAKAIGREDWASDPSLATTALRAKRGDELNAGLGEALKHNTTAYWFKRFEEFSVLSAPVQNFAQLVADPQAQHAGFFANVNSPAYGALPLALMPESSFIGQDDYRAPPRVGEHTDEVLAEFGIADAERTKFAEEKITIQG
ncbi:E-cinnamoyl-CoA:R-phenyllactate CoA transferase [Variibacter gotjawalensis]|uniref:E-cinnamoyl-CoA:R-phenyllactate CoA transferase n=1 Tax=Variibacter gotjawalensis TaxID=1333996 RepID=A0A0S3PZI3_9BRAD|nr:CoA transferase [Variibacter gotjawalensis]NIK47187.1 crotonobetainyl-CoA:carnitine CoA-transferase CaiB-like acyl-CoA transferase [Variibacter gotjawalensis]RZS49087.1 crotonobetainyl-CoA:carnitine CoA-transferase CaiB-like acyl-CoA transferase [Variibacter gotjawalensis]BAT61349.1 E-cinnamoyl-CoA:R-phenyllactate CoA transferase [Variibacter gotjawalensis]